VRRVVVRRDRRLDPAPALLVRAPTPRQVIQHPGGQTASAVGTVHRHLPDHQRLRALGPDVSGHETDRPALGATSHDRGAGEVTAPQQIAVRGVEVQDLRVTGYVPYRGTVRDIRGLDFLHRGRRGCSVQGFHGHPTYRPKYADHRRQTHTQSCRSAIRSKPIQANQDIAVRYNGQNADWSHEDNDCEMRLFNLNRTGNEQAQGSGNPGSAERIRTHHSVPGKRR